MRRTTGPCNLLAPVNGAIDIVAKTIGETWRLTAFAGSADKVYLAIDGPTTASRWIQMQPVEGESGAWSVQTLIGPGRHRLRYYTVENGTTLNCGTIGLVGQCISAKDPSVIIDDMAKLAVSA